MEPLVEVIAWLRPSSDQPARSAKQQVLDGADALAVHIDDTPVSSSSSAEAASSAVRQFTYVPVDQWALAPQTSRDELAATAEQTGCRGALLEPQANGWVIAAIDLGVEVADLGQRIAAIAPSFPVVHIITTEHPVAEASVAVTAGASALLAADAGPIRRVRDVLAHMVQPGPSLQGTP